MGTYNKRCPAGVCVWAVSIQLFSKQFDLFAWISSAMLTINAAWKDKKQVCLSDNMVQWFNANFMLAYPSKFQEIIFGSLVQPEVTKIKMKLLIESRCAVKLFGTNLDIKLRYDNEHVSSLFVRPVIK